MNRSLLRFSGLSLTMWLSLIGTQLTDFSLGIWVYEKEQSTALYGLIGFAIVFPQLVFSPLLGKYVDRFDHRKLMMLGHLGAAICTVLLIFLYRFELLAAWSVAVVAALAAICNCLVALAFNASIIYQVKKENLASVQGIVQASLGAAQILVPAVSAFLISTVGLNVIFLIDVISFSVVLIYLALFKLIRIDGSCESDIEKSAHMTLGQALVLFRRQDVALLIGYGVALSFAMGVVHVLIPPMMLDIANVKDLGLLASVAGMGMVTGSVFMAVRGAKAKAHNNLLWSSVVIGLMLLLSPLIFATEQGFYVMMVGAFLMMCCFALASGYSNTLWVQIIPENSQGRVFGLRNVALGVSFSIALLVSGFIVDYALKPMVSFIEANSDIVMKSSVPAYFTIIGVLVLTFSVYFGKRVTSRSDELKSVALEAS